jgi:hypothetical protein
MQPELDRAPDEHGVGAAIAAELRDAVERAATRLHQVTPARAAQQPMPGKWSPVEIIGHLVDSAANNHGRFVRAQLEDDLVSPGYAQDRWVSAQRYADAEWPELLELWRLYNRHLANVIAVAPAHQLTRARSRHNLDEIAFRTVPRDRPATLEYFMRDYIEHLEHHLRQIYAAVE